MPDKALPLLLLLFVLTLGSCSSPHYSVTLKDGREFMTASRPVYNAKTGYYRYLAADGKDALVRAEDVLVMIEASAELSSQRVQTTHGVPPGALPTGRGDEIVGVWVFHPQVAGDPTSMILLIRSDGTGRYRSSSGGNKLISDSQLTWKYEGAGVWSARISKAGLSTPGSLESSETSQTNPGSGNLLTLRFTGTSVLMGAGNAPAQYATYSRF